MRVLRDCAQEGWMRTMADLVCLGEALIDFVALEPCSDVGEASGFIKAPGGAPANVAVGAARLGCPSAFLGKVGDDPFGRFLQRTIADAGVDASGMVLDPEHRTGLAFVSLSDSGERDFCFFRNPSADMTYRPDEVDSEAIARCRVFHFGSITLIDPEARAATLAAIACASAASAVISYDPNLRPPLWSSLDAARDGMLLGMEHAQVVKVSEEELEFLFTAALLEERPEEQSSLQHAAQLMEQFPNIAILAVTCGAHGSRFVHRSGTSGYVPGFKVDAVDTTGSGDGFVAGLLTGLMDRGLLGKLASDETAGALESLFVRANAVGAITATRKGAIPALPTLAQVEAFLGGQAS